MNTVFVTKQGDLLPRLDVTLLDDGAPVDLTSATEVRFIARSNNAAIKINQPMTVLDQAVNRGRCYYQWVGTDTDTVGYYRGEVRVIWPGARPQTFPATGYFAVKIADNLL